MNITFSKSPDGKREMLLIDNARIVFRNFEGVGSKYNREGDRNFSLVIDDQEVADRLIAEGWNVKIKPPRDEDDIPFMHMPVKVNFNGRGPNIWLVTGDRRNRLTKDTVKCLDYAEIITVDLDINGSRWDVNGKTGIAAYLQGMCVVQEVDRFAERYAEEEYPEE